MPLSLVLLLAAAVTSWSQGAISFRNSEPFTTPDPTGGNRLVYAVGSPLDPASGVGLSGTNWVAELYLGTDPSSLAPYAPSISRFRASTTSSKGKWGPTTVFGTPNSPLPLPFSAGTALTLMVKVWDSTQFPTFEEAASSHGITGSSSAFSYVIPGPTAIPSAYYMEGLRAFALGLPADCVRHRAQATAQLANGSVVGVTVTDSGCGYTNPPAVFIQGGGGMGATATAVVSNTQVIAINITAAGCCYTSAPTVLIAPPWFRSSVSITASRVKVAQHVVLGRQYVLEASFDTINWTATGPPFIAQADVVENEFDVGTVGGFFRVRELP